MSGADRKREILDAACRVIARRGVRGLRVEELAAEAGVSPALIYYYFDGRADLLRSTLVHVDARAGEYTAPAAGHPAGSVVGALADALAGEIQDEAAVRENSAVWGELRASAWFDDTVRETVRRLTDRWVQSVAGEIERGRADGTIAQAVDARAAAERLTALVEGVSGRWLAGELPAARAQQLVRDGVARELDHPGRG